jgi:ABC-2 type transport system ATP-binding protein
MIEVRDLRKSYDDFEALKGLTFSSNAPVLTIVGRNGAGKTTLMRVLSTQLSPTSGLALVNGFDVVKEANKVRAIVCSIPQEAKPAGMASPLEHVVMYLTARGMSFKESFQSARASLKEVGLWEFKDKPCDELSGGMKRKVFVAMALASNADVVFLDEPTTGLDPLSRMEVWSVVKNLKAQVVLTTHYMEEAEELSKEIVLMHQGRVVATGTSSTLLKPLEGKVRVEGFGDGYRVGRTTISYLDREKAKQLVGDGYVIKPISLDDLFVLYGLQEN